MSTGLCSQCAILSCLRFTSKVGPAWGLSVSPSSDSRPLLKTPSLGSSKRFRFPQPLFLLHSLKLLHEISLTAFSFWSVEQVCLKATFLMIFCPARELPYQSRLNLHLPAQFFFTRFERSLGLWKPLSLFLFASSSASYLFDSSTLKLWWELSRDWRLQLCRFPLNNDFCSTF